MQISIPERSAKTFQQALQALRRSGVPHVVGGAFAMHHHTGIWRYTNDLDIYLERRFVSPAIRELSSAGFRNRGEMAPGDRKWIYHAAKNNVLVDLIWEPPNHLSPVDETFYERGPEGTLLGTDVRFLPADELIWAKIFIMNRHRCDWPDVFHVVRASPKGLDWNHLLRKMGEHWQVLLAFIILYDWAYPSEMQRIPSDLRESLLRRKQQLPITSVEPTREAILDPWIYTRPPQSIGG